MSYLVSGNRRAFLDAIAFSEIGAGLLAVSDNGYNVIVGSTVDAPDLFTSYADHPHKFVHLSDTLTSSAAGRYQLLARYYDAYKVSMGLPDFSPASQDQIALQQINERKAMGAVDNGRFDEAVALCSSIWASFPGSDYGQHTNALAALRSAYQGAGGTLLNESN